MDGPLTAEQRARIDQWVAEQLAQPWPLSNAQLDLIRRSLTSRQAKSANNTTHHAAIRTDVTGGAA